MLMQSWTSGIPQITILRILTVLKIKVVLGKFTFESQFPSVLNFKEMILCRFFSMFALVKLDLQYVLLLV